MKAHAQHNPDCRRHRGDAASQAQKPAVAAPRRLSQRSSHPGHSTRPAATTCTAKTANPQPMPGPMGFIAEQPDFRGGSCCFSDSLFSWKAYPFVARFSGRCEGRRARKRNVGVPEAANNRCCRSSTELGRASRRTKTRPIRQGPEYLCIRFTMARIDGSRRHEKERPHVRLLAQIQDASHSSQQARPIVGTVGGNQDRSRHRAAARVPRLTACKNAISMGAFCRR